MPSQHVPGKGSLQTLRTKVQTGHMRSAKKGCRGRELTAEELEACKRELAELEAKRKEGMEHRKKVAKETLQNTRDLKQGQAELKQGQGEIKDGVGRIEQKLDRILGAEGSSQHYRELAKQAAKREREEDKEAAKEAAKLQREDAKERRHLRSGLTMEEGDRIVDDVLVKAGVKLEGFEGHDLGGKFQLGEQIGCRLSMVGLEHIVVQFSNVDAFSPSCVVPFGIQKAMAYVPGNKRYVELQAIGACWSPKDGGKALPSSALIRLWLPVRMLERLDLPLKKEPKRRRTEEAAEPAAQPAAMEPAEAAPAEAAPAEQPPPAPPAPKPPSPEPLSAAHEQLPEILVHGVRCSHLVADYYIVKEVEKMLDYLRGGEAFPELLEIVLCIESTSPPLGTFYGMQLKPENRSQVPSTCAQLRLKLTFEQPAEPSAAPMVEAAPAEPAPQPPVTIRGMRCSYQSANHYVVKDVEKMLDYLRAGKPFPELLEIVVFICPQSTGRERHIDMLGMPAFRVVIKPENRSQVPSHFAELRLKLTDDESWPAAEPAAAEEPAPQQPAEKKPEDSEDSSTRAETEPAELPAIQDAEPADEEPAQTVRIFGEQGFDVEITDKILSRVSGDLFHAGQVLERLGFRATLQLFKDSRKLGTPQIFENVVPEMVDDRRSGKAFKVDGSIAKVTRVTLLLEAPTLLNGFYGFWSDGRREIISDFEALLMADPAPYGVESVETVDGETLLFEQYDPDTKTLRCEGMRDVPLSQVTLLFCDM
ncbi:unnamed protein product [Symbiodinium sp. CCMP2592]|nr:unnamed protein product [Symbiodinium sp. CCMP2592]